MVVKGNRCREFKTVVALITVAIATEAVAPAFSVFVVTHSPDSTSQLITEDSFSSPYSHFFPAIV